MLVLGKPNLLQAFMSMYPNTVVYNLDSLIEGFPKVEILPPINTMYMDQKQFDFFFQDYIFRNDSIFYEFMSKIMMPLYMGNHVYLLTSGDPFNDLHDGTAIFSMVNESLLKIIQCRYGYIGAIINQYEDIEYLRRDSLFSVEGIQILDRDKERWTAMTAGRMSPQEILNTAENPTELNDLVMSGDTYGL